MKIKITLVEEMLGTCCANPEVHKEFIASKSADADKMQEELESLPAEQRMEKALTVFPRDASGMPVLYDYQVKGFIKDAIGLLLELDSEEHKVGKTRITKFTFKRIVDNYVFISPRKIGLAPISGICTRPLRAETMKGERVSLASSETVPPGTSFVCEVRCLSPVLEPMVERAFDYGANKGLGQWRNSGKGRFVWERLD